ncbi:hypothetical protein J2T11_002290 [Paenarthrobacter nicotinovorans]|nr:hypothetical protein [Paenarthrobacter nicotinovorans]
MEDQHSGTGRTLRLDFFVGVDRAPVVGVAEVAVFRERQPIHAVVLGGVQLLLDHVLRVVAVLGVNVVVTDQPFQLGVVAAGVGHGGLGHRS